MSILHEWEVERLSGALGASVRGARLDPLDPATGDALYDLLMEHQVLVLPEHDLAPKALVALGRDLGELAPPHHSYTTHPDDADVVVLDWGPTAKPDAAEWHSDLSYRDPAPFASVLKAVVLPPVGGDTLWASMYSVHDALDPGLRSDLEHLSAVHDPGAFRTGAYRDGGNAGIGDMLVRAGSATWPVIAHHPVTGRAYVNVSEAFTRFIIGLTGPESTRILGALFDLINRPEHHVRLRWRVNTVAIWDNRATQHYGVADYAGHRRVMHRVAVATDRRLDASRAAIAV